MTIEQRIAALTTALAENRSGCSPGEELYEVPEFREAYDCFIQGASALAEVYELKGKIEAFQELRDLRLVDRAISSNEALVKAQLEALLASLEAK